MKFQKTFCKLFSNNLHILPNFEISARSSCRFSKMLQSAYLLAKIGADTAENGQQFLKIWKRRFWQILADSRRCDDPWSSSVRTEKRGEVGEVAIDAYRIASNTLAFFPFLFCSLFVEGGKQRARAPSSSIGWKRLKHAHER